MRTKNRIKRYIINVDDNASIPTTTTTTTTTLPQKKYQVAICSPLFFNDQRYGYQYPPFKKVTILVDDSYKWEGYMIYGNVGELDSFDRPDIINGYDWEQINSEFNYWKELPYEDSVIQRINIINFKNNIKISIEPNLSAGPFYYLSDLWTPTEAAIFDIYPNYTWVNEMTRCIDYSTGDEYWLSGFEEIGPLYINSLNDYRKADQSSLDYAKTEFIITYDNDGYVVVNDKRVYPVVSYNNTSFIRFEYDRNSGG